MKVLFLLNHCYSFHRLQNGNAKQFVPYPSLCDALPIFLLEKGGQGGTLTLLERL